MADIDISHLVIYQCGLERDLTLFDAADQTEVGEKGLTLRFVVAEFSALETLTKVTSQPPYVAVVKK